jgi:hypothetical protein
VGASGTGSALFLYLYLLTLSYPLCLYFMTNILLFCADCLT